MRIFDVFIAECRQGALRAKGNTLRMNWLLALLLGSAAIASGAAQSATASAEQKPGADGMAAPDAAVPQATPSSVACSSSADRMRAMSLGRALDAGFGVQYWGDQYTAEGLAEQPHGLLIIEVARLGAQYSANGREEFFTPQDIARISRDATRPVLGYLNVSEIEDYRDYWVDVEGVDADMPPWFGPLGQHGDRLSAYWLDSWRDVLLDRVDRLMATGVDGLLLDDVLHYYTHATGAHTPWPEDKRPNGPKDASGLAKAMMALVVEVSDRVREWNCDAFVVVNNGAFIGRDAGGDEGTGGSLPEFETYRAAIDGILVENALSSAAHPSTRVALTEDFQSHGLQVLTVDAVDGPGASDIGSARKSVAEDAFLAGFYPYVVDDGWFNRLWEPIPVEPSG